MKIAFDIGAHNGKDSIRLLEQGYKVFAFEPMLQMIKSFLPILDQYEHFSFFPVGIDIEPGCKSFHVFNTLSSIHKFDEETANMWYNDKNIQDKTHTQDTLFITLYSFCEYNNIDKIDYLHCDAQGNDFRVLQSLQDKISIVKEGVVEASGERGLYQVNNNIEDIKAYLKNYGFTYFEEVTRRSDAEFDLYFSR